MKEEAEASERTNYAGACEFLLNPILFELFFLLSSGAQRSTCSACTKAKKSDIYLCVSGCSTSSREVVFDLFVLTCSKPLSLYIYVYRFIYPFAPPDMDGCSLVRAAKLCFSNGNRKYEGVAVGVCDGHEQSSYFRRKRIEIKHQKLGQWCDWVSRLMERTENQKYRSEVMWKTAGEKKIVGKTRRKESVKQKKFKISS